MNDLLINIITNPAFGIVTFLIGILLGNHFALHRDRRKEFIEATGKFRNIFYTELTGLYPTPVDWDKWKIPDYLHSKFTKLERAIAEFRPFVPRSRRCAFDEAWYVYRGGKDSECYESKQCYFQYTKCSMSYSDGKGNEVKTDYTKTYKENFRKNVKALLEFAENK